MKSNAKRVLYIILAILVILLILAAVYISSEITGGNQGGDGIIVDYDAKAHTLGENFIFGLQTAGVGMGIVFAVLVILWGVIAVIPKIIGTSGPADKAPVATKPADNAPAAAAVPAAAEDEALIAVVCTTAIAAARGESDCAFKVISITKIQ